MAAKLQPLYHSLLDPVLARNGALDEVAMTNRHVDAALHDQALDRLDLRCCYDLASVGRE